MKTLVTGGAGFIGSHLVKRLLRDGHEVVVLDLLQFGNKLDRETRAAVALIKGDVRNERQVERAAQRCEWIFHLAAVVGVDVVARRSRETMETEVLGLRNVVQTALRRRVRKVVYASTSDVYGNSARPRAMAEGDEVAPISCYALAKRFNEIYLQAVFEERKLESVALRYFNVYGPGQDQRMVIPRFIRHALQGEPIPVFGNGRQSRDFTYVDEAVDATVRVARRARGCAVVNVASGRMHTIRDLAEAVIAGCDSRSRIVFTDPDPEREHFEVAWRRGSCRRLRELTGFQPSVSLREGLQRMCGQPDIAD